MTTAEVFSDQKTGNVVAQDPAAGSKAAPGTKVRINVSKGAGNVQVTSQVGNTVDSAKANLEAQGFKVEVTMVPSNEAQNTVVAQSPAGGSAPKGSTVQLNVSQGPSTDTTTTPTTPPPRRPARPPTVPTSPDTTATTRRPSAGRAPAGRCASHACDHEADPRGL